MTAVHFIDNVPAGDNRQDEISFPRTFIELLAAADDQLDDQLNVVPAEILFTTANNDLHGMTLDNNFRRLNNVRYYSIFRL